MSPSVRVVIHLDEREKAALVLRNTQNLIDNLAGVEVGVVAHADGVEGLRTGSPRAPLMEYLAERGVRFVVCENAHRSRNLSEKDFPGFVETLSSARGTGRKIGRRVAVSAAVKRDGYLMRAERR